MSYFLEMACDPCEGIYFELAIVNKNNGQLIAGDGIDHRVNICGERRDYGTWGRFAYTIASNANGLITVPQRGVLAINIPPASLFGTTDVGTGVWYGGFDTRRRSLPFKILAVPADPTFTKTLVTGAFSFGDRLMQCPRFQIGAYPLYPNAPSATGTIQVAQLKQQLAKIGELDAVEAALAGPTDPATISWNTGGAFTPNGPLGAVVASVLGYDPITMGLFLTAAGNNTI